MTRPFVVYSLPRSRTAWLSHFLTYRDWKCHHEAAITFRDPSEISSFFAGRTGAVETAAAQGWRLIDYHVPNIKSVVIRRPTKDVIKSMMAVDLGGVATYDEARLWKIMEYGNRMLDQIAARPGTLVVDHDALDEESTCSRIFEFCLPYVFDRNWWLAKRVQNIQVDVKSVILYYHKNRVEIERFKSRCRAELRHLFKSGAIVKGD